jgi:glutathione S-transferase
VRPARSTPRRHSALRGWLKRERCTAVRFVAKLAAAGFECSVAGARKWIAGERIPRADAIAAISVVTQGEVGPDAFYPASARAAA